MIEIFNNTITTVISSFDFAYCVSVNVLTYLIIKLLYSLTGNKTVSIWSHRIVLLIFIFSTGVLYNLIGCDNKVLLNSAILSPVFWSWVIKPICKYFKIDYKDINILD